MNQTKTSMARAAPQPLPADINSTQPGGGNCYRIELAWGRLRRWYLKRFRAGYVRRMAELRRGDPTGCPHEILDPRDLKYFKNQTECHWLPADDPFRWRDRLPFARWGLAELQLMGWPLLAVTIGTLFLPSWYKYLAVVPGVALFLIVYFFRDPPRRLPVGPGLLLAPADGKVVEISRLDHDEFIGGPAVRIGIFLTIFNVHINRSPSRARVIALRYSRGKFMNALDPASLIHNENMWIGLEEEASPHRKLIVRQIAGAIARRIVCDLRPGQVVESGEKFGMIKLGSRTELVMADEDGLEIEVRVGQWINAGKHIVARYRSSD